MNVLMKSLFLIFLVPDHDMFFFNNGLFAVTNGTNNFLSADFKFIAAAACHTYTYKLYATVVDLSVIKIFDNFHFTTFVAVIEGGDIACSFVVFPFFATSLTFDFVFLSHTCMIYWLFF